MTFWQNDSRLAFLRSDSVASRVRRVSTGQDAEMNQDIAQEPLWGIDLYEATPSPARSASRGVRRKPTPAERMPLEGGQNLVNYTALSNYLTQLSHAGRSGSQVVAIKINGIERIHDRATSDELVYVIAEIAEVIADAFKTVGHIMAYAGSGMFVVVSNKASLESSLALEAEIQYALDERNSEYDNGDPLDLEISIGNPILPSTNKTKGARQTIERALARAETRAMKKLLQPRPLNIRMCRT